MKKNPQYKIINVRGFYKIHQKSFFGWKPLIYILPKKFIGEGSRFGPTPCWEGGYGDSSLEDVEKLLKVIRDAPYQIFEKISYTNKGITIGTGRVVLSAALKVAGLSWLGDEHAE